MSRGIVLGSAQFSSAQLLSLAADERGMKRGIAELQPPNDRQQLKQKGSNKVIIGKIKIAIMVQVERRGTKDPNILKSRPQSNDGELMKGSQLDAQSFLSFPDSTAGPSTNMFHAQSRAQSASVPRLPSRSLDEYVRLPCSFTLHSVVAMELMQMSTFHKNIPVIKVLCEHFYQISEVGFTSLF
jgi:hypothetical protein